MTMRETDTARQADLPARARTLHSPLRVVGSALLALGLVLLTPLVAAAQTTDGKVRVHQVGSSDDQVALVISPPRSCPWPTSTPRASASSATASPSPPR